MGQYRFEGGEVVRLRDARDGVAGGCCGVVWGVYDHDPKPPVYEATFVNQDGEDVDVTFEDEHVDKLDDMSQVPFRERLVEIQRVLLDEKDAPGARSGE